MGYGPGNAAPSLSGRSVRRPGYGAASGGNRRSVHAWGRTSPRADAPPPAQGRRTPASRATGPIPRASPTRAGSRSRATSGGRGHRDPRPARRSGSTLLCRNRRESQGMKIRLHALALLRDRVNLVATPVDLDAPDLPAAVDQHLLELFLRLPLLRRPRIAGGESRGV